MDYFGQLRRFLYREFIPITKGTIVLSGLVLVLSFLLWGLGINLGGLLALNPRAMVLMSWTLITYPLVNDILSTVFAALWLWFVGGSLERTWGGRRYGSFLVLTIIVSGVVTGLVGRIVGVSISISGFWMPLVGLTWAWSDLYPDREVLFWGIIPVKSKWLAWIHAALIFGSYFQYHPFLGIASVSSILLAFQYKAGGPSGGRRFEQRTSRRAQSKVIRSRFRIIK